MNPSQLYTPEYQDELQEAYNRERVIDLMRNFCAIWIGQLSSIAIVFVAKGMRL